MKTCPECGKSFKRLGRHMMTHAKPPEDVQLPGSDQGEPDEGKIDALQQGEEVPENTKAQAPRRHHQRLVTDGGMIIPRGFHD